MSQSIKHLLVPVDTSDAAPLVLKQAIASAKAWGAKITLISVLTEVEASEHFRLPEYGNAEKERRQWLQNQVDDIAAAADFHDIKLLVPVGDPRHIIIEMLKNDRSIDAVFMGATGKGPVERWLIGSVASYVARHAPVPVLLLRNEIASMDRILVPTDSSDYSERAITLGADLAKQYDGKLDLLVVAEDMSYYSKAYDFKTFRRSLREQAENYLNDELERLKDYAIDVNTEILEGDPRLEITQYAEEGPYDLIIMGAAGKGSLQRLLLGSVSEYVLSHTTENIVIIH